MGLFDFFKKNKKDVHQGLEKTRKHFWQRVQQMLTAKRTIDQEVLDNLEEILILSDIGIATTEKILKVLKKKAFQKGYQSVEDLLGYLREAMLSIFLEKGRLYDEQVWTAIEVRPYVILVVGVNGVGKTTTIGKLAYQFHQAGNRVLLAAADTFRAAAVEQLRIWAQRSSAAFVEKGQGADPAAVAYSAVEKALKENYDVVIIDTAGRLHNKSHLMRQLGKIHRVIKKQIPEAPHEVLLVLDASTGQNALRQAQEFMQVTNVSAIALTKLDGTAKGGVVLAICDQLGIPVKYIGIGEQITDLQLFNPYDFVDALLKPTPATPA